MSELKHTGVKGMRWGIRRDRNRPGGADGKSDGEHGSGKSTDKRGKIKKRLDSWKRERQWHEVLKDMDKLDVKDIKVIKKRLDLENELKSYSKSVVAKKKDKEDYLHRANMSDAELTRKVARLKAMDGLHKSVKEASKEQRQLGERVVKTVSTLGIRYGMNRTLTVKDLKEQYKEINKDLNKSASDETKNLLNEISRRNNHVGDVAQLALSEAMKNYKKRNRIK